METKFNFKSQICTTREQSERLLSLGLKKETADMALIENWEYDLKDGKFFTGEYFERPIDYVEGMTGHYIPAWSLHRLIEMMPDCLEMKDKENYTWKYLFRLSHVQVMYEVYLYERRFSEMDNVYNNIIDCIEWLIKEGYFNKEYLV